MALIECPECKNQLSSNAKSCIHCGAPIAVCASCGCVSIQEDAAAPCPACGSVSDSEKDTTQKQDDNVVENDETDSTDAKDLQTVIKEYQVYDGSFKATKRLTQILGTIFLTIPIGIILPIFIIAFISLVKSFGSISDAFSGLAIIFELGGSVGDIMEICFGSFNSAGTIILAIISYLICMFINLNATGNIYAAVIRKMVFAKARSAEYDYRKTLKRLKKDYENEQASIINLEDMQENVWVWDYALYSLDPKETTSKIMSVIFDTFLIFVPLIYSIVYVIAYGYNSDFAAVAATISIVLVLVLRYAVSKILSNDKTKRKLALIQKCKQDENKKLF